MTTLAERLDTAQQMQTMLGTHGSWHQDSAKRCLDLVTSVIEPEIAERVAAALAGARADAAIDQAIAREAE